MEQLQAEPHAPLSARLDTLEKRIETVHGLCNQILCIIRGDEHAAGISEQLRALRADADNHDVQIKAAEQRLRVIEGEELSREGKDSGISTSFATLLGIAAIFGPFIVAFIDHFWK
jgi:hypothetical protein